jgi:hypothetical protein
MKPSMKFFTFELFRESQRTMESGRATVAWDQAVDEYRRSVDGLRAALPPKLRELLDKFEFHDAAIESVVWNGSALDLCLHVGGSALRSKRGKLVRIRYEGVLDAGVLELQETQPGASREIDVRSLSTGLWLYDEVRSVEDAFEHHVLIHREHETYVLFAVRFKALDFSVTTLTRT